jgi:hypothetical protein
MYMRNRYYDPQSGQFTQMDPIGLAGGLNVYGFAAGDPVSYSDPYGLKVAGDTTFTGLENGDVARQAWHALRSDAEQAVASGDLDKAFGGMFVLGMMSEVEESSTMFEINAAPKDAAWLAFFQGAENCDAGLTRCKIEVDPTQLTDQRLGLRIAHEISGALGRFRGVAHPSELGSLLGENAARAMFGCRRKRTVGLMRHAREHTAERDQLLNGGGTNMPRIHIATTLLILMLIHSVSACGVKSSGTKSSPTHQLSRVTRFNASETGRYLSLLGHCGLTDLSGVQGTWDVTVHDVQDAHTRVMLGLATALDSTSLKGRHTEYLFQYFGVVIQGRRALLVNGFHELVPGLGNPDRWRTEPVNSCDVGPAAFQVIVDVETGNLNTFRFDQGWPARKSGVFLRRSHG